MRQQKLEEKKNPATPAREKSKPAPVAEVKPKEKAVESPEAVKAEPAAVAEAPKKRVRQRIKVSSATAIMEKVNFLKKK